MCENLCRVDLGTRDRLCKAHLHKNHGCTHTLALTRAHTHTQAYWVQRLERAVARGKDGSGFMTEQKELQRVLPRALDWRVVRRTRMSGFARLGDAL